MKSPYDIFNDPRAWSPIGGSGGIGAVIASTSMSGETVTPGSAARLAPFYACMRAIAEDIGQLSLEVYEDGEGGEPIPIERDSIYYHRLHRRANDEMAASTLYETLTGNAIGWGNGYAEISRSNDGKDFTIWPIHPSRVVLLRDDKQGLFYRVRSDDMKSTRQYVDLLPDEVLHLHGLGEDGLTGTPLTVVGSEEIGLAQSIKRQASRMFTNGMPNVLLTAPMEPSEAFKEGLRGTWSKAYGRGGGGVAILPAGFEAKELTINPQTLQMIESQELSIVHMCMLLRVPPHKIQHLKNVSYDAAEHMAIEYVHSTLLPWCKRIERELWWKILRQTKYKAKFNVADFLRGDAVSQAESMSKQVLNGLRTVNSARRMLGQPDVEGGDRWFMPVNVAPIDANGRHEVPSVVAKQSSEPPGGGGRPPGSTARASGGPSGSLLAFAADAIRRSAERDAKSVANRAAKADTDAKAFGDWTTRTSGMTEPLVRSLVSVAQAAKGEGILIGEASIQRFADDLVASRMASAREAYRNGSTNGLASSWGDLVTDEARSFLSLGGAK